MNKPLTELAIKRNNAILAIFNNLDSNATLTSAEVLHILDDELRPAHVKTMSDILCKLVREGKLHSYSIKGKSIKFSLNDIPNAVLRYASKEKINLRKYYTVEELLRLRNVDRISGISLKNLFPLVLEKLDNISIDTFRFVILKLMKEDVVEIAGSVYENKMHKSILYKLKDNIVTNPYTIPTDAYTVATLPTSMVRNTQATVSNDTITTYHGTLTNGAVTHNDIAEVPKPNTNVETNLECNEPINTEKPIPGMDNVHISEMLQETIIPGLFARNIYSTDTSSNYTVPNESLGSTLCSISTVGSTLCSISIEVSYLKKMASPIIDNNKDIVFIAEKDNINVYTKRFPWLSNLLSKLYCKLFLKEYKNEWLSSTGPKD